MTYGLPVLVTLICSKLVGDFFGKGIYDVHIDLKEVGRGAEGAKRGT